MDFDPPITQFQDFFLNKRVLGLPLIDCYLVLCVILRQGFPRIIPYSPLGMPFEKAGSPASSSFRAEVYAPIVPFANTPTISEGGERKKQISLYPLGVENHTQTCFMYPTRLPRRRHQIQPDMFAMPCPKV